MRLDCAALCEGGGVEIQHRSSARPRRAAPSRAGREKPQPDA
jgi:hypothetical protein